MHSQQRRRGVSVPLARGRIFHESSTLNVSCGDENPVCDLQLDFFWNGADLCRFVYFCPLLKGLLSTAGWHEKIGPRKSSLCYSE